MTTQNEHTSAIEQAFTRLQALEEAVSRIDVSLTEIATGMESVATCREVILQVNDLADTLAKWAQKTELLSTKIFTGNGNPSVIEQLARLTVAVDMLRDYQNAAGGKSSTHVSVVGDNSNNDQSVHGRDNVAGHSGVVRARKYLMAGREKALDAAIAVLYLSVGLSAVVFIALVVYIML